MDSDSKLHVGFPGICTKELYPVAGEADQAERDSRSIFIGNVDFATSVEEVRERSLAKLTQPRGQDLQLYGYIRGGV